MGDTLTPHVSLAVLRPRMPKFVALRRIAQIGAAYAPANPADCPLETATER